MQLRRESINEAEATQALAKFEPVWECLTLQEQGRLLQLLVERIEYDGGDGTISVTFHSSGIRTLGNHEQTGDGA